MFILMIKFKSFLNTDIDERNSGRDELCGFSCGYYKINIITNVTTICTI